MHGKASCHSGDGLSSFPDLKVTDISSNNENIHSCLSNTINKAGNKYKYEA